MTMFITVCAIIFIGIVVAVMMDRIMRTHDTQNEIQVQRKRRRCYRKMTTKNFKSQRKSK